jgi:hypothetical protein
MKAAIGRPGSAVCRAIIVGSTRVEGWSIVGVSVWARGCTSIGTIAFIRSTVMWWWGTVQMMRIGRMIHTMRWWWRWILTIAVRWWRWRRRRWIRAGRHIVRSLEARCAGGVIVGTSTVHGRSHSVRRMRMSMRMMTVMWRRRLWRWISMMRVRMVHSHAICIVRRMMWWRWIRQVWRWRSAMAVHWWILKGGA